MSVTLAHRRRILAVAAGLLVLSLLGMLFLEVPSLGIGYFLYLPVALVALATSPLSGAAAGIVAGEVYALGVILSPRLADDELITTTSGLRLLTYATIGALIGKFVVDQRELASRLRTLADIDPLTGLLNARAYEAALSRRLGARTPFALLLADLDGLKEINDTRGHIAGNEALTRFAATLAGAVRREDAVARIGGDEFAVLVGGAGAIEAEVMTERLRETITAAGLSASLGWAAYPEDGSDGKHLFESADRRLYEHKALRRAQAAGAAGRPDAVPAEPLV
jgi:diguanylate cyclase (GGDEF)-like protein